MGRRADRNEVAAIAKAIGKRVRGLRRQAGLSQEKAARLLDMDLKQYQFLEYGSRPDLHLSTLARVARAFRVPLWAVFLPSEPIHARRGSTRSIAAGVRRLSPGWRHVAATLLREVLAMARLAESKGKSHGQ